MTLPTPPSGEAANSSSGAAGSKRPPRLGQLLCERGLITPEQLEAALQLQRAGGFAKQLGKILVEQNLLSAERVVEELAESLHIPYARLTPAMIQHDVLGCLPEDFVERNNLLPISLSDGCLSIAVEQFTNVFLIEDIGRRARSRIRVVAAEADNIRQVRKVVMQSSSRPHQGLSDEIGGDLGEILGHSNVDDLKVVVDRKEEEADLLAGAADSPVVKLVNYIVHKAVEMRASDIHIEPEDGAFRVRYRVDGELIETVRPASGLLPAVVSRIKIMAGMDISERRLPQDGGVTVTIEDRPIDLRVSTMATRLGEKVVLRIVDRESGVRALDSLGLDPAMLARFRSVVREPNGIALVTGPTGSGKTTTLYAALAELVSHKQNISTIEDPVERRLAGTNQFQVQAQAGFTFGRALRSLLRQDPDIIMVGEIRDSETAKLATEAALTGHLVLSTLHTNDAATAVPRLINMGAEPYLVAASVRGVLAQRLVKRLCPHCRHVKNFSPDEMAALSKLWRFECPLTRAHISPGCSRCVNAGNIGRIGVFELLVLNEELLSTIVRDPTMRSVREFMQRQGMPTLVHDALAKAAHGLIGLDGVLEMISRQDDLVDDTQSHMRAAA